jgi:O-acetyl-ADP-ribose deacetylase (regulator of RNase III)
VTTEPLVISRPDGSYARIELAAGDITRFPCDAIINAANPELSGGSGVDGAIHWAAGPEVMDELRARYRGCAVGSAVITGPARLRALGIRHIIHAVGPIWHGGGHHEPEQLAQAYHAAFGLARNAGDWTIALPAISCGVYGYPLDEAAAIAINTVAEELRIPGPPDLATFVLYLPDTMEAFDRAMRTLSRLTGDL